MAKHSATSPTDVQQMLKSVTGRRNSVRVAGASVPRALAFICSLADGLAPHGLTLGIVDDGQGLRFVKDGTGVFLELAEKYSGPRNNIQGRTYSGVFTVMFRAFKLGGGSQRQTADQKGSPLEHRVPELIAVICSMHAHAHAEVQAWRQPRAEPSRQPPVQPTAHTMSSLLSEVEAWERAERIRRYVACLDGRIAAGAKPAEGYASWRDLAIKAANSLDPSVKHLV